MVDGFMSLLKVKSQQPHYHENLSRILLRKQPAEARSHRALRIGGGGIYRMYNPDICLAMTYDPPLSVSFRSLIKDGKFYKLDGEGPITAPYYSKFIRSVDDLTPVEINYIIIKYSRYNLNLQKLATFVDKMKI